MVRKLRGFYILTFVFGGLGACAGQAADLTAQDASVRRSSSRIQTDCAVDFARFARVNRLAPGRSIAIKDTDGNLIDAKIIAQDDDGVSVLVRGLGPTAVYRRIEPKQADEIQPAMDPKKRPREKPLSRGEEVRDSFLLNVNEPVGRGYLESAEQFVESERAQKVMLLDMGVKTQRTSVKSMFVDTENPEPYLTRFFENSVLEVTELPKPGRGRGPGSNALQHPEMAAYLAEMKADGFRLVTDLSLIHTGAAAYMNETTKVIAITPMATWNEFVHEFEHYKLDKFLKARSLALAKGYSPGSADQVLPKEVTDILKPQALRRLNELEGRGMPEQGYHETLAVDAELRLYGFRRYISPPAVGSRAYALRHQVTALLLQQNRTPEQDRLLRNAIARQAANSATGLLIRHPIFSGVTGAAGGSFLYVRSILYSEKTGETFVETEDGKWTKYHATPERGGPPPGGR